MNLGVVAQAMDDGQQPPSLLAPAPRRAPAPTTQADLVQALMQQQQQQPPQPAPGVQQSPVLHNDLRYMRMRAAGSSEDEIARQQMADILAQHGLGTAA